MAVDTASAARYIGATLGDVQEIAQLNRFIDFASALVDAHKGDTTPVAARDLAVLRIVQLSYSHRGSGEDGRLRPVNLLNDSGAAGALAPWVDFAGKMQLTGETS